MKKREKKSIKNPYWYLFFILLSFRIVTLVFFPDKSESEKDFPITEQLEKQYSEIKKVTSKSLEITFNKGVSKSILINLPKVHFDLNKYTLKANAQKALLSIARILNRSNIVIIEGHTDSSGPDDFNDWLAFKRAESVYNFLYNKINVYSISYLSFGKRKPIANNITPSGRALNRRVEIKIKTIHDSNESESESKPFSLDLGTLANIVTILAFLFAVFVEIRRRLKGNEE